MSCERMESRILSYVDGRLEKSERAEVQKHLDGCAACRVRVSEFSAVNDLLDELPILEPSPAFDVRVRARIAAELGSDVPFAIRGGTALGRGRGEILRYVQLNKSFRAVIAVPRWRVSTAQAYREIDRKKFGLTVWRAKLRFARKLAARRLKPEQALDLGNTFDRVLGTRVKEFDSLRARLRAAGLADVVLTGSGSAVFGLLKPGVPASRVARRFTGSEWLYAVRSVRAGLRRVAVR